MGALINMYDEDIERLELENRELQDKLNKIKTIVEIWRRSGYMCGDDAMEDVENII